MNLRQILKDPECRGNIQCAMWGIVITTAMLCVPIYGIAWMSTAEKISADVYGARRLENRIEVLENRPALMEHVHPETNKKFTGRPIEKAAHD